MGGYGDLYHTTTTPPLIGQSPIPMYIIMREFGIKQNRYANCRIALVGEMIISLLGQSRSKDMVSYPELVN